jgi:peroxiredoxin
MRLAVTSILLGGCVPRLYSEDYGNTTGDWTWEAPQNSWTAASPPAGTVGQGYEPGQIVPDVRLVDQFGDEVSLWQFHGQLILFDISTMWCGPCQDLGAHTEQNWQDYQDQGFVYVTVLQQDFDGDPTEADDVDYWVDTFGITAPVLADPAEVTLPAIKANTYPAVLLIGRNLKVIERVGTLDSEVRAAIKENL